MLKRIVVPLLPAFFFASFVLGHEGNVHVMGTVTEIKSGQVTVKTVEGRTVTILLAKDTKYLKGNKSEVIASASDMKVGQRVVIDVTEKGKALTATEVRLGIQESTKK